MTHYTTNGTAFLSTTTPFHSCATDLAFPVFRCASHPQMCNVDTVRSTEVGLIESRTSRASTGMQTPTGQLQSTLVNTEDARARFPSWLNTGASPRATEEDAFCRVRHSTLTCNRVSRPADMPSPMSTHGSAPLPTPTNLFWPSPYCKCGHTSRSQDYILSISAAPNSAHRAWNLVRSIRASTDQALSLASRSPSPLCNVTAGLATPLSQPRYGAPPGGVPPPE